MGMMNTDGGGYGDQRGGVANGSPPLAAGLEQNDDDFNDNANNGGMNGGVGLNGQSRSGNQSFDRSAAPYGGGSQYFLH